MRNVWDTPLGQARLEELRTASEQRQKPAGFGRNAAGPRAFSQRMYASARASRLTSGWQTSNTSADAELVSSLTMLRSRSRALIRDSSYAKRARVLVVNNVIGTGMGLQARVKNSRGELHSRVNDQLEDLFCEWADGDSCHTGGRLHFRNLERLLMAEVFAAGEVFIRKHARPFGRSRIPFALEVIEAERLADEWYAPHLQATPGMQLRMGVEMDQFFRPVAYYFRRHHPSEVRWSAEGGDAIERVPADQVIHLAIVDRWPQTRGEPWLHTVVRRLNDMDGYSEAEVIRARSQAVRMGIIETPEDSASFGEVQDDGSVEMELEPGVVQRLSPGEKWHDSAPNAPNPQLEPFMRYMLREVAAGAGPSYESLSRDYSQSNYSSSRLALLDDRDLWRYFQSWFITDFRALIHRDWLRAAVLSRAASAISVEEYALDPRKFEAVRFKPRGWTWVDPTKEVAAFKEAVKAGFTTVEDVVAQTAGGADIEDVLDGREDELEQMRAKGLVFDTSPEVYTAAAMKQAADAKAANRPPPKPEPAPAGDDGEGSDDEPAAPSGRVLSFQR